MLPLSFISIIYLHYREQKRHHIFVSKTKWEHIPQRTDFLQFSLFAGDLALKAQTKKEHHGISRNKKWKQCLYSIILNGSFSLETECFVSIPICFVIKY